MTVPKAPITRDAELPRRNQIPGATIQKNDNRHNRKRSETKGGNVFVPPAPPPLGSNSLKELLQKAMSEAKPKPSVPKGSDPVEGGPTPGPTKEVPEGELRKILEV